MKIVLTGAPGWLGNALLDQLAGGVDVHCLVHETLAPTQVQEWQHRYPWISRCVTGDLVNPSSRQALLQDARDGLVLHSAACIHPRHPREWYQVNRDATLALAEEARRAGVRRFVYVSSNAAQGMARNRAQRLTESDPCHPLSHYGQSKYEAEQGLMKLHAPGEFEIVIARPCMFYGPAFPERHAMVLRRIRAGSLPLVGGGAYSRSLSYIDDLVYGLLQCLRHPLAAGEIFNLCDDRPYSTLEICQAMATALNVRARFIRLPAVTATVAYRIDRLISACGLYSLNFHLLGEANWNVGYSNDKARQLLGYRSSVDVVEGYRRAIVDYQSKHRL